MTVICPSCDSRFRDPPMDVARTRPMQCGKCDHKWYLEHPVSPRVQLDAPSMAPDMADIVNSPDPICTALPVVMKDENDREVEPERPPLYVDRAPVQGTDQPISNAKPMIAMAAMALIAAGLIFKDAVMAELPQTTPIYKAAGLATDNSDLEIANVETTKVSKDGISQLIVKGEIQNTALGTVAVPPLKVTMRGEKDASLYAWTVSAGKGSLRAGEKSRFTAVAHNFPQDAVNVEVEFAPSAR